MPTAGAQTGSYQWDASYSGDVNNDAVSDVDNADEQVTVAKSSPTLGTSPSSTSVTLDANPVTLKDTADLAGGYNETGSITFTLYYDGGATAVDTETVSVSGDGSYATPTGFTLPSNATATGTYQWDAAYSGDVNNNAVSDVDNADEQVTVAKSSPTLGTSPSSTSVTLGANPVTLKDTADLAGGYNETGFVTFTLYYDGGATAVDTETVSVSGDGSYSTPTGFTLPSDATATGTYQWDASYSGDANNDAVSDAGNADEQVTVSAATPKLSTSPSSTSVTLGANPVTLKDTADLAGGYNETGSITFTLYYDGNATAVDTETVSVSGDGSYSTPTGFTLPSDATATGTYQWDASYSGDANNNAVSDVDNADEQVTVAKSSPTLSTSPSSTSVTLGANPVTLKDTADLTGGYNETGSITFTLYYDGGATAVDTETVSVSGDGSYSTPTGFTLPSNATATGTYQWDASYSGDANNNAVSDVDNADEQLTVSAASPTLGTSPSSTSVTLGANPATLKDTADLTGGYNETGTSPSRSTSGEHRGGHRDSLGERQRGLCHSHRLHVANHWHANRQLSVGCQLQRRRQQQRRQ